MFVAPTSIPKLDNCLIPNLTTLSNTNTIQVKLTYATNKVDIQYKRRIDKMENTILKQLALKFTVSPRPLHFIIQPARWER